MATEDENGKLTWKSGFKNDASNASGNFGVCESATTKCDAPYQKKKTTPNPKENLQLVPNLVKAWPYPSPLSQTSRPTELL
jgi:hypothetical protein